MPPKLETNNTLFNQHSYIPKNKSVMRMMRNFESKYNPVFSKVRTHWLPSIREFLREETGLKMHQKIHGVKIQKDSNISFEFVTDRENKFIQLIDMHYPELDFDEYSAFNILYSELKNSQKHFDGNSNNPRAPYDELIAFFENYFKKYDLNLLLNTLFKSSGRSADIWGTYTYKSGRIEVYYVPLILFCQIRNVPLEHAILSTLVHEMAHAYHHIGKDKDNVTWDKMSSTDLKIVEGMAEYFTWLFVETYKNNHPQMEKTYEIMFDCLGEEYTIFKKWTPAYSREAIKSALLGTRKKALLKYVDFEMLLVNIQDLMH